MRRALAWFVMAGVLVVSGPFTTRARAEDGFWVTIAAGAAGAPAPSDYSEFWFDSPHAPPIAVNQITGDIGVQATTGGGSTFFSGLGTPVLLPTTDGYATVTNPGVANGSGGLPRFAGGTQASGAPQTGEPLGNANLLSLGLGEKAPNGSQVLTVGVTDPNGASLGNGQITVPEGGWWVIGLGPGSNDTTGGGGTDGGNGGGGGGTDGGTGGGTDGGNGGGGGTDGGNGGGGTDGGNNGGGGGGPDGGEPLPGTGTGGNNGGGTVTTPEPASLVLLSVAGLGAGVYHRLRRK